MVLCYSRICDLDLFFRLNVFWFLYVGVCVEFYLVVGWVLDRLGRMEGVLLCFEKMFLIGL